MGKQKKFEDNGWFVGYAPRRNPEIVVAVLVQESGKHGGEAAGPVVKDVIKAYYDKKNKKTQGQYTAENKSDAPGKGSAAVIAPRAALKPEDSVAVVPGRASTEPQRERISWSSFKRAKAPSAVTGAQPTFLLSLTF